MHDLLVAVALMLVIEGILPFANPRGFRNSLLLLSQMDDRALRIAGIVSMLAGLVLLYLIR